MPSTTDPPKPTFVDVRFGPRERNLLTVWLAVSNEPSPVVMTYHPGGFRERPKRTPPRPGPIKVKQDILRLVRAGISVVAPSHDGAMMEPFEDAARALQFVRTKASDWSLDTERIAATGASSGGCLSLWLAYHEDMAKPDSKDPVARQSTRLNCVAVNQALTSVNPWFIRDLMPGSGVHEGFCKQFYGVDMGELDALPDTTLRMMDELSPINHAVGTSPPTLLRYDQKLDASYDIHHPNFGFALKEKMDETGAQCDLVAGGKAVSGSVRKTIASFIRDELLN